MAIKLSAVIGSPLAMCLHIQAVYELHPTAKIVDSSVLHTHCKPDPLSAFLKQLANVIEKRKTGGDELPVFLSLYRMRFGYLLTRFAAGVTAAAVAE